MHLLYDKVLNSYPYATFISDLTWYPKVLEDKYNVNDIDLTEDDVVKPLYQPDALVAIREIHHPFRYDDPNLFTYRNLVQKFRMKMTNTWSVFSNIIRSA